MGWSGAAGVSGQLRSPHAGEPLPTRAHALLRPLEFAAADEVFLTSTAGGVMPATRIDGAAIGDGTPGPLTRRIKVLYWEKHCDPEWSEPA